MTTIKPPSAVVPAVRFQVLVDHRERPSKCTILPLAGHPALDIVRTVRNQPVARLAGDLLLHPDGETFEALRGQLPSPCLVSAIDSTWKHLVGILNHVERPLPRKAKIPDGFVTAYPRRNKENLDPEAGLATIEALFLAGAFLGSWDETLLSRYHFAGLFLELNRDALARYGLGPSRPG